MGGLTRTPLSMVSAFGKKADAVRFNGNELELQPDSDIGSGKSIIGGDFDPDAGVLTILLADGTSLILRNFLTTRNIGVGPTGPTGPSGKPGSNGRNGKDGAKGDAGCAGPKGDAGPQGPTGPAGQSGGIGLQGATGPTGPKGPTGPAGTDGKSALVGILSSAAYEKFENSSLKAWGRFTDPTAGLVKKIVFPEAFTTDQPRALFLQPVDPTSPVAFAVGVNKINRGNAELQVDQSRLPTQPDGAGGTTRAAATGWDFFWFVIGANDSAIAGE